MDLLAKYQTIVIPVFVGAFLLICGRFSVDVPNHAEECRPEIQALEVAEKQISDIEATLAGAEARGLKACIARERRSCQGQIEATEEAGAALDCIICRKRCTDGSIP